METDAEEQQVLEDATVRWRRDELRRLGYTHEQRVYLMVQIAEGKLELHYLQHLGDDLKFSVEQAWRLVY